MNFKIFHEHLGLSYPRLVNALESKNFSIRFSAKLPSGDGELPLCFIKHHAIKTYEVVEV
jgi:hypothetical protein